MAPLWVLTPPVAANISASAACPDLPYDRITPAHCLFDLVYNPAVTEFMKRGAARGARTCNGLAMLTGQAEAAWDIWNNG